MSTVVFYRGEFYADTRITSYSVGKDGSRSVQRGRFIDKLLSCEETPLGPRTIYGFVGSLGAIRDFLLYTTEYRKKEENMTAFLEFEAVEWDGEELLIWSTRRRKISVPLVTEIVLHFFRNIYVMFRYDPLAIKDDKEVLDRMGDEKMWEFFIRDRELELAKYSYTCLGSGKKFAEKALEVTDCPRKAIYWASLFDSGTNAEILSINSNTDEDWVIKPAPLSFKEVVELKAQMSMHSWQTTKYVL